MKTIDILKNWVICPMTCQGFLFIVVFKLFSLCVFCENSIFRNTYCLKIRKQSKKLPVIPASIEYYCYFDDYFQHLSSPGNLLKMQILSIHPHLLNQQSVLKQVLQLILIHANFENHHYRLWGRILYRGLIRALL